MDIFIATKNITTVQQGTDNSEIYKALEDTKEDLTVLTRVP